MCSITVGSSRALLVLWFLPACNPVLRAQSSDTLGTGTLMVDQEFSVTSRDSVFVLSHRFILPGSERVALDSLRLAPGSGYRLDRSLGHLVLGDSLRAALHAGPAPMRHLRIRYRVLP